MIKHETKMNLSRPATPKWKLTRSGLITSLLAILIALTINSFLLLVPPPVSVTRHLYFFRVDTALLLILFYGIVLSRKGPVWEITNMTLVLALFSVPLIYKWQTAGYYGYLIGGLLPWSDAQGYYSGAYQLIYYGQLNSWATRRPLFGAFLAVLLSLTGQNLQITLAIMAMLN